MRVLRLVEAQSVSRRRLKTAERLELVRALRLRNASVNWNVERAALWSPAVAALVRRGMMVARAGSGLPIEYRHAAPRMYPTYALTARGLDAARSIYRGLLGNDGAIPWSGYGHHHDSPGWWLSDDHVHFCVQMHRRAVDARREGGVPLDSELRVRAYEAAQRLACEIVGEREAREWRHQRVYRDIVMVRTPHESHAAGRFGRLTAAQHAHVITLERLAWSNRDKIESAREGITVTRADWDDFRPAIITHRVVAGYRPLINITD